MAYVAFDLDNTLGFFEITNQLAHLWCPVPQMGISDELCKKLKLARTMFADQLLNNRMLLITILRPSLTAIIPQLLHAKHKGSLRSVVIYSNTGSKYSMELAKYLIETRFNCPGFFSLMVDRSSPLRVTDYSRQALADNIGGPEKTFYTLQQLFKRATGESKGPSPHKVIFIDDLIPKHKLEEEEINGLNYIVPTAFYPMVTQLQKDRIVLIALYCIEKAGLMQDKEYLSSGFCNQTIGSHKINGFIDIYQYVFKQIRLIKTLNNKWVSDTDDLKNNIKRCLNNIKG